jgi:hypothetical protein
MEKLQEEEMKQPGEGNPDKPDKEEINLAARRYNEIGPENIFFHRKRKKSIENVVIDRWEA